MEKKQKNKKKKKKKKKTDWIILPSGRTVIGVVHSHQISPVPHPKKNRRKIHLLFSLSLLQLPSI
jgi:hypothetical protein